MNINKWYNKNEIIKISKETEVPIINKHKHYWSNPDSNGLVHCSCGATKHPNDLDS